MKYTAIIVGIAFAIGFTVYRYFKLRDAAPGGFRDWLKNPGYKESAADYFAAREALHVPENISVDQIQQMVDRLFKKNDKGFNLDRLKLVGAKAIPLLIKALENPKTASMHFGDGGHAFDAQSPFERIVGLLEPFGPVDAAGPIAKYMQHQDDYFRKHAAIALGNIGVSECIEPMLKALGDDDDYVRSYAMMGIQRGIKTKRCTREFLEAMFPSLEKLLDRDDRSISGKAPILLLEIDAERATPILLSQDYFSVQNKQVHYIIQALNVAGVKVPHDRLLPFLNAVKPLIGTYPHHYDYAEALLAYAHNPDASAEELFRIDLKSTNEKVQEAAAQALSVLSGVTNARKVVFDALDKQGFNHLTPPQQHYFAVFIYDAEVNNGGHSQYFVNSSGDHWRSALEGLKALGAESRAMILREATELFGTAGPPVDNELRHSQLSAFTKHQDKLIDGLDSRYFACDENIDTLLAQYALKNKEHFTDGSK